MDDDKIKEFCNITGAGAQVAEQLLQVCNGNLEMAINMHMEGVDVSAGASSSGGAGASAAESQARSSSSGTQAGGSSRGKGGGGRGESADVDVESFGADEEDGVRAPIPQRQDRMISPGYEGYALTRANPSRARIRSVFDGFRNFGSEQQRGSNGASSSNGGSSSTSRGKKRTLEELFKPPLDIMFKGDLQDARDSASAAKKWLLINIQDAGEFQCQVLNRDVWSNKAVKTVISEHFLFWQQYKESDEAQRFLTFYPNAGSEWPYVVVLDPRTGEKLVTWEKFDANSFCDLVTSFLKHQTDFNGGPPSPKRPKSAEPSGERSNGSGSGGSGGGDAVSSADGGIIDADEDDQLAAAIKASLAESEAAKIHTNKGKPSTDDNDDDEVYSDLEFTDDENSRDANSVGPSTPRKAPAAADCVRPSSSANTAPSAAQGRDETDPSGEKTKAVARPESGGGRLEAGGEGSSSSWEEHLGDPSDPKSSIMIRFPDGQREAKNIPSSSTFMAITKYVTSRGFALDSHEIVTNFPRRILTDMDETKTLKDLGLFPQETVFVQKR